MGQIWGFTVRILLVTGQHKKVIRENFETLWGLPNLMYKCTEYACSWKNDTDNLMHTLLQ